MKKEEKVEVFFFGTDGSKKEKDQDSVADSEILFKGGIVAQVGEAPPPPPPRA